MQKIVRIFLYQFNQDSGKDYIEMAYDFSGKEIFEMAQHIERNGAAFYKKASEGMADEKEKQFLLRLSEMEVEHEKTFAALQKELIGSDSPATVFDPDDEAGMYLKALADTRVFFEKDIDTSTMKSILKEAVIAEKDSIVFYLGMKDLVPGKLGKDKIDAIIKEEMGHITLLGRELAKLKK